MNIKLYLASAVLAACCLSWVDSRVPVYIRYKRRQPSQNYYAYKYTTRYTTVFFQKTNNLPFDLYNNYMCAIFNPRNLGHSRGKRATWYSQYTNQCGSGKIYDTALVKETTRYLQRGVDQEKLMELKRNLLHHDVTICDLGALISRLYNQRAKTILLTVVDKVKEFYVSSSTSSADRLSASDLKRLLVNMVLTINGIKGRYLSEASNLMWNNLVDLSLPDGYTNQQKSLAKEAIRFLKNQNLGAPQVRDLLNKLTDDYLSSEAGDNSSQRGKRHYNYYQYVVRKRSINFDYAAMCYVLKSFSGGSSHCGIQYLAKQMATYLKCPRNCSLGTTLPPGTTPPPKPVTPPRTAPPPPRTAPPPPRTAPPPPGGTAPPPPMTAPPPPGGTAPPPPGGTAPPPPMTAPPPPGGTAPPPPGGTAPPPPGGTAPPPPGGTAPPPPGGTAPPPPSRTTPPPAQQPFQGRCGVSGAASRVTNAMKSPLLVKARIVGGSVAGSCQTYPWMAYVAADSRGVCGGAILDETHILTAAHCVDGASSLRVTVGEYDTGSDEGTEQVFDIDIGTGVFMHEDYDLINRTNDIAVLKLNKPIEFTRPCVETICLDPSRTITNGESCVVAGWGATVDYGRAANRKLKGVSIPVFKGTDCDKFFPNKPKGHVLHKKDDQLCAGDPKVGQVDTCVGDSGSPLFCQDQGTSRWVAVGVVSYGWANNCGTAGYPSVYTRVASYSSWIQEQMMK